MSTSHNIASLSQGETGELLERREDRDARRDFAGRLYILLHDIVTESERWWDVYAHSKSGRAIEAKIRQLEALGLDLNVPSYSTQEALAREAMEALENIWGKAALISFVLRQSDSIDEK